VKSIQSSICQLEIPKRCELGL